MTWKRDNMAWRCQKTYICLLLLAAAAQSQPMQDVLYRYKNQGGDIVYLNSWGNGIYNFPITFWNAQVTEPCPSGNWIGVQCNDHNYVEKIDLSISSLPGGTPRLSGEFRWIIAGVLFLNELNLAGNNFNSSIPPELALSPHLHRLNLANNSFNGHIPSSLCSLDLHCINLEGNNLTGSIPPCLRHFPCMDFANTHLDVRKNVTCQDVPSHSCDSNATAISAPLPPSSPSPLPAGAIAGITVGCTAAVALLAVLAVLWAKRREVKRRKEEVERAARELEAQISSHKCSGLRRFSLAEMSLATNGFAEDNVVGEGGSSRVYKGTLQDGKTVAVKCMKVERLSSSSSSSDPSGHQLQFLEEVQVMSRAAHRCLVHCMGFCVEEGKCMLVLPFYANGSVASRTQEKEGNPLAWPARRQIACLAAEAVAYLHTDLHPKLIHRDIKAANVLLDDNDLPVIADFGLARPLADSQSDRRGRGRERERESTVLRGTLGHIAPEYLGTGQCSEKTDVYAFGVFLLELVTGRDAIGVSELLDLEDLPVHEQLNAFLTSGRAKELLDPELVASSRNGVLVGGGGEEAKEGATEGEVEEDEDEQVEALLCVALACVGNEPSLRPAMRVVCTMLTGRQVAVKWQQWKNEREPLAADVASLMKAELWALMSTDVVLEPAFEVSGPR